MYDPHGIHRKRKADSDDQEPPDLEVIIVDPAVPAPGSSNAPRQPWLASDPAGELRQWSSPPSPHPLSSQIVLSLGPRPPKRMKFDHKGARAGSPRRYTRRPSPGKILTSRPPPIARLGNDVEDQGIVSNADPGPSSGSLLRLRGSPFVPMPMELASSSTISFIPIDPNSPHIPSLQPLINRQTLKELDLDAILRNPQLRHDILFDSGLQFRPTSSRRKRDVSEKYWNAITRELESGCTCVSFDLRGKPHSIVCACKHVSLPSSKPIIAFSPSLRVTTLRMPSRIRPLLAEFLEVLLLVIQPLSSISGMYVNPEVFNAQMQEHAAQATYIRSIFDPALIEQELRHQVFDPSGLFHAVGVTLKAHCAPMRDQTVEAMVQAAEACAPNGQGTKADAVKAVRMCMDILELMKLDIANHQLQTLRPFLIRTSGQFELGTFRTGKSNDCSLRITREWLQRAHCNLHLRETDIPHPLYAPAHLTYRSLSQSQQMYIAVLKGFTDLVFDPPVDVSSASLPSPVSFPPSPTSASATISSLPGYPETSYLDNTRLVHLGADAADVTAMYMFLLLYRQLLFSESKSPSSTSPRDIPKVEEADLITLKREIRDIGSSRLGNCFTCKCSDNAKRIPKCGKDSAACIQQDVLLQIARRVKGNGSRSTNPSSPLSPPPSPLGPSPDERVISLASRWAESNMHRSSSLTSMVRNRLRDVVFNAVVASAYPARDSKTGKIPTIDLTTLPKLDIKVEIPRGNATGMEVLVDEIRSLAEKISRLALIHLNAYLPLYEQDGFLESSSFS